MAQNDQDERLRAALQKRAEARVSADVDRLSRALDEIQRKVADDHLPLSSALTRAFLVGLRWGNQELAHPAEDDCAHPSAAGKCMPNVRDGKCIWCGRELPSAQQLENREDGA